MTMNPQITVPPLNEEVVDWFQGHFNAVYAILHPFIRVPQEYRHLFCEVDVELTRTQLTAIASPVSWVSILELTGIPTVQQLNCYLRERIFAHIPEHPRSQEIAAFQKQLVLNDIVEPREGALPELLLDDFLRSFTDWGYKPVFVGSEFGESATKYQISDLLSWEYPTVKEWHPTLYTEDHSLLYGVNWDSCYTFLCGTKEIVTKIVDTYNFEGFFFEPGIRVFW